MFGARLNDPSLLVNLIKAAYELVKDDVIIQFSKTGMLLRATDPANVAMIGITIDKSAFESYEIDEETSIGINMDKLYQVLRRVGRTDTMNLSISAGKLELEFAGRATRKFSIPLLALEGGPKQEPNLQFTAELIMESNLLKESVDDASVVSDAVVFVAKHDTMHLIAQGDLGETETILKKDKGLESIDVKGGARAKYSLEYLSKMMKGTKIGSLASIEFKTDYPLRLEFKDDNVQLVYVLAPRIDVD
ncbi:MAG: proliferating cell nuclear antigen (pcna) [Candidatus Altiarchaeota archaeon]|nr:proliferating cell nuclear antigen (pcna) [Candidatus Altiarchaeota archaeon]